MKFARVVFVVAGILGLMAMVPMYLAGGSFRYYGSLGAVVAWQIAFFVIAFDPTRYRALMVPATIEKLLWVGTLVVMYFRGNLTEKEVIGSTVPHGILGALFVVAYIRTRPGRN